MPIRIIILTKQENYSMMNDGRLPKFDRLFRNLERPGGEIGFMPKNEDAARAGATSSMNRTAGEF
jgi:hypothetical protein